jgi:hypothetical protein
MIGGMILETDMMSVQAIAGHRHLDGYLIEVQRIIDHHLKRYRIKASVGWLWQWLH